MKSITETSEISLNQEISQIKENINNLKISDIEDDSMIVEERYIATTSILRPMNPEKRTPSLLKSLPKTKSYDRSIEIDVEVLLGTVSSINVVDDEFEASLISAEDDKLLTATFSFEDIQYESDKPLIREGARFVLTLGKERRILEVNGQLKYGEIVNVSRIRFRRTKRLNKKALKQVEEDAESWANFFAGLD